MKISVFSFCLLIALQAIGQDPLVVANKCYSEKNYECASEQYKRVVNEKKYAQDQYADILYKLGYALAQLKRNEEAIKYLKDASAVSPSDGNTYWSLGWVYENMENDEMAAENYSKAINYLRNNPKSLKTLYYSRGNAYYAIKKDSLSLLDFQEVIKLDSTVGSYYAGAANAAYSLKRYTDAAKWYQKSIQLADTSKKVMSARYYLLGQTFFKQLKYEDALTAYKTSLQVNPSYGSAQWGTAAVYYNQKKWTDAAREYGKAINLYTIDTASLRQLYYLRGKSYNESKELNKALADLESALKINPNYRDALWERASIFYQQKKYKEAIPDYSKAIELYKGDNASLDDLYYYRGYCYIKTKDTASAKLDLALSLSLNYSTAGPNTQMGNIRYAEKKYADARNHYSYGISDHAADSAELSRIYFRKGYSNIFSGTNYFYTGKEDLLKSVKYDSTNKESHRYLADVYYAEKYFSLAEAEMDKCIRLYKNIKDSMPMMHIYRASSRWQQKKYAEALADYEQSDKLKKFTDPERVKAMGQLAFEVKDYPKTISIFTRLIQMYKQEQKNELMFAYFGRGRASLELNKKEPAVADLKKALELLPGNAEIKGWLDKAQAL